jgi:hypothetical protein
MIEDDISNELPAATTLMKWLGMAGNGGKLIKNSSKFSGGGLAGR